MTMSEPRGEGADDAETEGGRALLAEIVDRRDEVWRESAALMAFWGVRIADPLSEARAQNLDIKWRCAATI